MDTTRTKWDESMEIRCLAKLKDCNAKPAKVKKLASDKYVEVKKTGMADKPAVESTDVKVKGTKKGTQWEDFIKAIDKAM